MEIREKRFSVIGGARSGVAVARLLKAKGAAVFLSDKAPKESMKQAVADLDQAGIAYEFGRNTERALEADVMVLSPGVPSDVPLVRQASAKGLKIISEIEVASWFCKGSIVAITGTNGKTTTTTLAGRMFEDAKQPCVVAGNIGVAFSQVVEQTTKRHTAILEVSSFQLDTIDRFRPSIAVLLNITPDHLDRYDHSMEKYVASKCRVFKNQRSGDAIVYNYDDDTVRRNVEQNVPAGVRLLPFSTGSTLSNGAFVREGMLVARIAETEKAILPVGEISIRGRHNLMNAMAATLVGVERNISVASLRATLRNFKGVEHRLEFVRERNGIAYVNDSKATNVDSVWYALQSFTKPIILLLGGRDKGNDYAVLVPLVQSYVKAIVAIGESADKVMTAFDGVKPVRKASTMQEAVETATNLATNGDVVLLSPACASFDWFENYEHRGRVFKEIVMKLR